MFKISVNVNLIAENTIESNHGLKIWDLLAYTRMHDATETSSQTELGFIARRWCSYSVRLSVCHAAVLYTALFTIKMVQFK